MNQKTPIVLSLIAVVIALAACFLPAQMAPSATPAAGGITTGTNYPHGISVGNTPVLGTQPSNIAALLTNTCSLIAASFTVAATTSVNMDCAVTGALANDIVFAQFATSSVSAGWNVVGASASTTANFITLTVYNGTGASAVIPASIASTTKYLVLQTQ